MSSFTFPPPPPPPPKAAAESPSLHSQSNQRGRGGYRGGMFHPRGRGHHHRGSETHRGRPSYGHMPSSSGHDRGYGSQNSKRARGYTSLGTNDNVHPRRTFQSNGQPSTGKPPRVKAAVPPTVPSFGSPVVEALAQSANRLMPGISFAAGQKRKRTTNQLGLTPQGEDYQDSEEEEEVDEEAKYADATASGPLRIEYNGQTSVLGNPAEIAAWIAERKKRWPTKARIEEKQKLEAEKQEQIKAKRRQETQRLVDLKIAQQAERQKAITEKASTGAQLPTSSSGHSKTSSSSSRAAKQEDKLLKQRLKLEKLQRKVEKAAAKMAAASAAAVTSEDIVGERNLPSSTCDDVSALSAKALNTSSVGQPKIELPQGVRPDEMEAADPQPVKASGPEPTMLPGETRPIPRVLSEDGATPASDASSVTLSNLDLSEPSSDISSTTDSDSTSDSDFDSDIADDDSDGMPEETTSKTYLPPDSSIHLDADVDGNSSNHASELATRAPQSRPVCRTLLRFGRCKFGNRCRYSHDLGTQGQLPTPRGLKKDGKKADGRRGDQRVKAADETFESRRMTLHQRLAEGQAKEECSFALEVIKCLARNGFFEVATQTQPALTNVDLTRESVAEAEAEKHDQV